MKRGKVPGRLKDVIELVMLKPIIFKSENIWLRDLRGSGDQAWYVI
jgi:hypothetical protein